MKFHLPACSLGQAAISIEIACYVFVSLFRIGFQVIRRSTKRAVPQ